MNKAQIIALIVPLVVGSTTALAEKFGITPTSWQSDVTDFVGITVSLVLLGYQHFFHSGTKIVDSTTGVVKSGN